MAIAIHTINLFLGKRAPHVLFLALIFLISCSSPHYQWELITLKADCPCLTYSKIYFNPCSKFNGLQAEFLSFGVETHFFLNALTLQFPESDNGYLDVTLRIEEQRYVFPAERLEGGQRLQLPDEAQELISENLLQNYPVEVIVGRYKTVLIPDNFALVFSSL